MAEDLIRGLLHGGHPARQILASAPRRDRLDEVVSLYDIATTTDNREVARKADILVLSIKPQILDKVVREITGEVRPGTLVVSVAAGIDTATIEGLLPEGIRVVRSMPNTPALVRAGATAICTGRHAGEEDLVLARALFDAVGLTVTLD